MDKRYSLLVPNLDTCFVCGTSDKVHIHHVFFGNARRQKSEEDHMIIGLCPYHHNMSKDGVHFNKQLDNYIKKQAEKIWIANYCDDSLSSVDKIQKFINRYGINYLEEEELNG